jgi:uncharacterized coiled-coil DUF342 family protein
MPPLDADIVALEAILAELAAKLAGSQVVLPAQKQELREKVQTAISVAQQIRGTTDDFTNRLTEIRETQERLVAQLDELAQKSRQPPGWRLSPRR